MPTRQRQVNRGHVVGVLLANAGLWAAAVLTTGSRGLAGLGAIGLISIGTLLWLNLPGRD